jgi:osmotically-inducible protein OsmY
MNEQRARADERIREEVRFRFRSDGELDASKILVLVRNGEVTLDGSVDTRKMRQRAADVVGAVKGVTSVKNRVVVRLGPLSELARRFRDRYSTLARGLTQQG